MKEYNFYFFDLYHTLVKIEPYYIVDKREYNLLGITQEKWNEFIDFDYENRALGKVNDPDQIIKNIITQKVVDISDKLITEIIDIRKLRFKKALVEVKQSIFDAIFELNKRNKRLILISNADALDKMYWDESPLSVYFHEAIFSCEVGYMKPNIEIYNIAIQKINADISKSVFIGDGGHNELKGAKEIGMDTVLTTEIIHDYWPEKINDLIVNADYTINNLSEILCWN
jgi:putative hydrolase of the HAD superfamily